MSTMIDAQGLTKVYALGPRAARYETLREAIMERVATPVRWLGGQRRSAPEEVRALDGASFRVAPGEVVGVIGRNGAGKSTLLKLLARITEPTAGRAELHGRVGSLLEVGTGFHPELTGRENVLLSGSILGMSRAEIRRKFEEIVAFAGVERFLDTPVERYSTGMHVRLAFAVAAHLEPEILLIDEVLAVGDATFQRKCLGKLESLGSSGRTVLFVSHSMPNVLRLCGRALLLEAGRVVADGKPAEVARTYLSAGAHSPARRVWEEPARAPGDAVARLHSVAVLGADGAVRETADIREPLELEVRYWALDPSPRPTVSLWVTNEDGVVLFASNDFNDRVWYAAPRAPGLVRARCRIPGNFLAEGQLFVLAAVCSYNPDVVHAIERDAVSFQVADRSEGDGVRGPFAGQWPGVVRPMLEWDVAVVGPLPGGARS